MITFLRSLFLRSQEKNSLYPSGFLIRLIHLLLKSSFSQNTIPIGEIRNRDVEFISLCLRLIFNFVLKSRLRKASRRISKQRFLNDIKYLGCWYCT